MTQTLHEFIERLQKIEKEYNASDWTLQKQVLLLNDDDEYTWNEDIDDFTDFDLQIDDEHGHIIFPADWDYDDEEDDDWDDDDDE